MKSGLLSPETQICSGVFPSCMLSLLPDKWKSRAWLLEATSRRTLTNNPLEIDAPEVAHRTLSVRRHENHPTRCSMSSRTASCSCGQLRIQVEGEPRGVGICHCLACQQRTGSVFAALASFSAPFKVFGTATEYIRVGDQGAKFIFRFCPVCGTTVFHTEDGHNESVGVAVGAFADPNFPAPRVSIYDSRRHPWVQLPPGTRTFDKDPT